jgi:hypothetical protein
MFSIGSYRIMHESEYRKFEKLHRIFREYDEADLDRIISGTIHLRRSPGKRKPKPDAQTAQIKRIYADPPYGVKP